MAIVDLAFKNGDFPVRYVSLPEGTVSPTCGQLVLHAAEDALFRAAAFSLARLSTALPFASEKGF
jgi:hypothetical protein